MVPLTDKLSVQNLLKGYSIEATAPLGKRIARFGDIVATGTRIYIPHSPSVDFRDFVTFAVRLRSEGMEPVPHIVARRITNLTRLDDLLRALSEGAGVTRAPVVTVDLAKPAGELGSTLEIIESGLLEKYRIRTVGAAGHPEGHRYVGDAVLHDALKHKNNYPQKQVQSTSLHNSPFQPIPSLRGKIHMARISADCLSLPAFQARQPLQFCSNMPRNVGWAPPFRHFQSGMRV
jgi:hypothetical protein